MVDWAWSVGRISRARSCSGCDGGPGLFLLSKEQMEALFPACGQRAYRESRTRMNTRLVVVTQLQHAEAVLRKIRETYQPEIMWVRVREERINPEFPLEIQVKGDSDAHDYLDSPLCWIEVGLHRFHEERDDRFLTQLAGEFKIINSF